MDDPGQVHPGSTERVRVTTRRVIPQRAAGVPQEREPGAVRERDVAEAHEPTRDRVRWGPIVAGLLTALTALLLLSLLGLALGLTTLNPGAAAGQGGLPGDASRNAGIWAAIAGILSFLLGGFVAGKTAAVSGRGWGAFNGAMVFLLAVPITLWLAGQGLGALLGSVGNFVGGLDLGGAADQARRAAGNVQPGDLARAAEQARNGAWGALVGSLLGLGASALGGFLGAQRDLGLTRLTGVRQRRIID